MTHADQLRKWAKGIYTKEAATELLIRGFNGRFAEPGNPWIQRSDETGPDWYWIDFERIPDNIGPLSGGEQAYLELTASLGDYDTSVKMGDAVISLDAKHLRLVLSAVAHTSGLSGLYPWPDAQ